MWVWTAMGCAGRGAAVGAAPVGACELLAAQLDDVLAATSEDLTASGLVAGVATPACTWIGARGEAAPGVPLAVDDLLRIGSVTKTAVAATVLQLVDRGALDLDEPLAGFAPTFPNAERITLRMLLAHTSGTFDLVDDAAFMAEAAADPGRTWTTDELLAVAAAGTPAFEPSTSWAYSNTDYLLLGVAVEQRSGASAGSALRADSGLGALRLEGAEALPGPVARCSTAEGADVTDLLPPSIRWTAGAGVVDAPSLLGWTRALLRGDVLSAAAQDALVTVVPGTPNGLGVFVGEVPGVGTGYGHSGAVPGCLTQIEYAPDTDVAAIAVATQEGAVDVAALVAALLADAAPPG